tara:strand:+ start:1240 stop:1515 length:276 start_codon:yes stop_codon:yes gene_type:complete
VTTLRIPARFGCEKIEEGTKMHTQYFIAAFAAATLTWNMGFSKADDHATSEGTSPASYSEKDLQSAVYPSMAMVINISHINVTGEKDRGDS